MKLNKIIFYLLLIAGIFTLAAGIYYPINASSVSTSIRAILAVLLVFDAIFYFIGAWGIYKNIKSLFWPTLIILTLNIIAGFFDDIGIIDIGFIFYNILILLLIIKGSELNQTYRKIFYVILSILILLTTAIFINLLSRSRTSQAFGELISRIETDQKVIALTFDDAPSDQTDTILRILREKKIPATFFMIGENIEKYPLEAQAIVSEGHEVGNHSYSHKRLIFTSYANVENEIEKTNSGIRELGYEDTIHFRPPNGKKMLALPYYLKTHNIKTIMWDIEPDTYFKESGDIIKFTVERTRPGSIILMHPFCSKYCQADRDALPQIIDKLQSQGYSFVTVSELLEKKFI